MSFIRYSKQAESSVKFSIVKHAYLQCYGLAVNDIFVGADSRNETIHLTETIVSADLLVLLKTKDRVRERNSSACRDQAARSPSMRRTDASYAGKIYPCRETRLP